jgi:L-ascorbate metabolism protein UlaG (beta-lactamase superfamily)
VSTEDLAFTWWGHASVTVEIGGVRIAIDPLFSDRLVHLRRYAASPAHHAWDADVVLVSHLHADHLHRASLRRFAPDIPVVIPRGGEVLLRRLGPERVHGVEPGEVHVIAGARITVLPATHEGRRGPQSKAVGPALGFRVDAGGRSFWFPGDTELRDDMADVGRVDLALVPIGGWGPTLEDGHMDPVAGAAAVERVGATTVVPVHWGTFWPVGLKSMRRANHELLFRSPGRRFVEAMAGSDVAVVLAKHGERVVLS